ncbi:MAG: hypothetical protein WC205_05315 [Opitutaceae bacterium]|jgi:photosystem II stability/assembly factor-like uncharacterized protein
MISKILPVLIGAICLSCLVQTACTAQTTPPHRQYGAWASSVIGGGGFLQHAVFAPSDPRRLYLSSDVGGLFRSDDNGATWHMLHGSLPAEAGNYSVRGVLVDPRNADRVTIATDTGVWRSTDAGKTWTRLLTARFDGNGEHRADGRVLVASPRDPAKLYAAAIGTGVHISSDGGKTWRAAGPTGLFPVDLFIDRRDPRHLWLSARPSKPWWAGGKSYAGGFYFSADAGDTWEKLSDSGLREIVQDPNDPSALIALKPGPDRVVRSTDLGRTWTRFDAGLPPAPKGYEPRKDGSYGALATGPDFTLLGGNGASIYRLDRGSSSWAKITWVPADIAEGDWWGGLSKHGYPHFGSALGWLAVNPANPRHWVLTDWYAIYRSPDSGHSWQLAIDGIEMTVAHTVSADPSNPKLIHVGLADVGYFRSTDGGATFQLNKQGISNNIKHIAVAPSHPARLYAVGPREWHWYANQVFVSDDAGLSWTRSPMTGLPDMKDRRCNTIAVHPQRPDEAWLVIDGPVRPGQGGVWKSTDAGQSWTWSGAGLPEGAKLFRTDIWVAGPEIAVSADDSRVAVSDDSGRVFAFDTATGRWREIPFPANSGGVNAIVADPATAGRFYLARKEGGLWRSDDGGQTWSRLTSQDTWSLALDAANPSRLALNGAQGLFVSTDSGATWQRADEGLPYRHARNVPAFAGDRLVIATGGNGVFWRKVSP